MIQGNRKADENFKPTERLYLRCNKEDVLGGRIIGARFKFSNQSVNRSKYSKPWDVVFEHKYWGIARWITCDLPPELPQNPVRGAKLHYFRAGHNPLPLNYSHSEIWTFKDGQRILNPSLPSIVKKELQTIMGDRSLVLYDPEV